MSVFLDGKLQKQCNKWGPPYTCEANIKNLAEGQKYIKVYASSQFLEERSFMQPYTKKKLHKVSFIYPQTGATINQPTKAKLRIDSTSGYHCQMVVMVWMKTGPMAMDCGCKPGTPMTSVFPDTLFCESVLPIPMDDVGLAAIHAEVIDPCNRTATTAQLF